jgi:hypothetical protein
MFVHVCVTRSLVYIIVPNLKKISNNMSKKITEQKIVGSNLAGVQSF